MRTGVTWAAIGVAVGAALVACAGPAQVGTSTREWMSDDQATAVADGVISSDEYESGFSRYRSCLAAEGYALVLNGKKNESYQFGIPAEAVDSGVDQRCYEHEFREIDIIWQLAHQDTST